MISDGAVIVRQSRPTDVRGAGVGFSGFDGLIRLDVARGFSAEADPHRFYLGGKF